MVILKEIEEMKIGYRGSKSPLSYIRWSVKEQRADASSVYK